MSNTPRAPSLHSDEWTQAADKAKEAAACVGEMAHHAASAVGAMASQAAGDLGQKADDLTANAGMGIKGLGDRLSDVTPEAGVLGGASRAVAKAVKGGGEYMEEAKLSGMTADLARVIRANPIPAVLIGIAVGCFLRRKLRS